MANDTALNKEWWKDRDLTPEKTNAAKDEGRRQLAAALQRPEKDLLGLRLDALWVLAKYIDECVEKGIKPSNHGWTVQDWMKHQNIGRVAVQKLDRLGVVKRPLPLLWELADRGVTLRNGRILLAEWSSKNCPRDNFATFPEWLNSVKKSMATALARDGLATFQRVLDHDNHPLLLHWLGLRLPRKRKSKLRRLEREKKSLEQRLSIIRLQIKAEKDPYHK
jgi:hypothetical protein